MQVEIKIPAMGESVVEVTIGSILKPSGTFVKADEEVIEIETDKVNQVLYAPAAGKIQFSVKSADVVKVGDTIGFVESSPSADASSSEESKPKQQTPAQPPSLPIEKKEAAVSPSPRKKIDEALQEMQAPLPSYPVTPPPAADSASQTKTEVRETRKKMSKLRRVIAERLVEIKNQTAMLTTFNEVDMSAVMTVREKEQEQFQKKHGIKLGLMSFFLKASVAALQEFPNINGRIEQDEIVYPQYFHIGVAVSTERGLMVPIIRDVNRLSFAEIEKQLKNFAEKARNGTISVDDMQGGSFTITNGGVFGSLLSTPILNPPQSAILGMHNIVKRPVAINDEIMIRPMMYLALSYDHRIIDGKESIQFLVHIKQNLEEPTRLLLDL